MIVHLYRNDRALQGHVLPVSRAVSSDMHPRKQTHMDFETIFLRYIARRRHLSMPFGNDVEATGRSDAGWANFLQDSIVFEFYLSVSHQYGNGGDVGTEGTQ